MYYHQQHVEHYAQETDEAPYEEYAEEPQEEQPWSDQYYVPEEPNYGEYEQEYKEYGNYWKDNDTPQTQACKNYEVAMDKIDIYTDQVPMTLCVVQFMQNKRQPSPI